MKYLNYETGDVPWSMRDTFNKCVICGETWIGAKRAMCSKCISDDQDCKGGDKENYDANDAQ